MRAVGLLSSARFGSGMRVEVGGHKCLFADRRRRRGLMVLYIYCAEVKDLDVFFGESVRNYFGGSIFMAESTGGRGFGSGARYVTRRIVKGAFLGCFRRAACSARACLTQKRTLIPTSTSTLFDALFGPKLPPASSTMLSESGYLLGALNARSSSSCVSRELGRKYPHEHNQ